MPVLEFFNLFLVAAFYILPLWLLWRAVRAIEKIANRMERITDNENARE